MRSRNDHIPRQRFTAWGCALWNSLLVGLLAAVPAYGQENLAQREYEIKAAFLYHFAQFVEWPEKGIGHAQEQVVVCVFGEDPFGFALDELEGKTVKEKTLTVQRLNRFEEAETCHVAFIGSSEAPRLSQHLQALAGASVLTVGEGKAFTKEGGIIGFYKTKNKIRFEVNLEAANEAGIKISSKMLKLARIV